MSNKSASRAQNRMKREDRVPVGGMRDIMSVRFKETGYQYRWITDESENGSRIYKYERGGWEFAPAHTPEGKLIIGDRAVYKATDKDEEMVRLSVGQGQFAFLMRIKDEWYLEDQRIKEDEILEMERGIIGAADDGDEDGQYGEIELKKPTGTLRKKDFRRQA